MADPTQPIVDVPKVNDHSVFGKHIIQWALMKPELRPKTVGELRSGFPEAAEAMYIPPHVGDDHPIEMAQGNHEGLVFQLPPVHKLLAMFNFLEKDWRTLIPEDQAHLEVVSPASVPKAEMNGPFFYEIPAFYFQYVEDIGKDGANSIDYDEFFSLRVGDYAFQGCR